MAIDLTELDAIVSADWGEPLSVGDVTVSGCSFAVRSVETETENGLGILSRQAVATLPASSSSSLSYSRGLPPKGARVVRSADGSEWAVHQAVVLACGRIEMELIRRSVSHVGGV